jgi:peroxiredoxin Q/BCP
MSSTKVNVMARRIGFLSTFLFALDRMSKQYFLNLNNSVEFGSITLMLHKNAGFMLGTLTDIPLAMRVIGISAWSLVLALSYITLTIFFPVRSRSFQFGLSLFFISAMSNILDRIYYGFVIDGIMLHIGEHHTGIFNIADFFQWIAVASIFYTLLFQGHKIWPKEERRTSGTWLKPEFQIRLCILFSGLGLTLSLVTGFFGYAFMKWSSPITTPSNEILNFYLISILGLALSVALFMFYFGRTLSFRIVGPIFNFERFLDNILLGKVTEFKLRDSDEGFHFQALASQFQSQFHQSLGISLEPLPAGYLAPGFHAVTYNQKSIRLEAYKGKRVWLCLYRYATCLLCIEHLAEVIRRYPELQKNNIEVIAIFESKAENFLNGDLSLTQQVLKSAPFPLISDPEKSLYAAYRAPKKWSAFFKWSVLTTAIRAHRSGYRHGVIDGEAAQIPAHILIDENGKILESFHGHAIDDHIPWADVNRIFNVSAYV